MFSGLRIGRRREHTPVLSASSLASRSSSSDTLHPELDTHGVCRESSSAFTSSSFSTSVKERSSLTFHLRERLGRKDGRTRSIHASVGSSVVPTRLEPPQYQQKAVRAALKLAIRRPNEAAFDLTTALASLTCAAPHALISEVVSALVRDDSELLASIIHLIVIDNCDALSTTSQHAQSRPLSANKQSTIRAHGGAADEVLSTAHTGAADMKIQHGLIATKLLVYGPNEIRVALAKRNHLLQSLNSVFSPTTMRRPPHVLERVADILKACLAENQANVCSNFLREKRMLEHMVQAVPLSPSVGQLLCRLVASRALASSDKAVFMPCHKKGLLFVSSSQSVLLQVCSNPETPANHLPELVWLMSELTCRAIMVRKKGEDPEERVDRHFTSYLGIVPPSVHNDSLDSLSLFANPAPLIQILDFVLEHFKLSSCSRSLDINGKQHCDNGTTYAATCSTECDRDTHLAPSPGRPLGKTMDTSSHADKSASIRLQAVLNCVTTICRALLDDQKSVVPTVCELAALVDASLLAQKIFERTGALVVFLRCKNIAVDGLTRMSLRLSVIDAFSAMLKIVGDEILRASMQQFRSIRCSLIYFVSQIPAEYSVMHCRVADLFEFAMETPSHMELYLDHGKLLEELLNASDLCNIGINEQQMRSHSLIRIIRTVGTALQSGAKANIPAALVCRFESRFLRVLETKTVLSDRWLLSNDLLARDSDKSDAAFDVFQSAETSSLASEDYAQELFMRSLLDEMDGISEPTDVAFSRAARSSSGFPKSIFGRLPRQR